MDSLTVHVTNRNLIRKCICNVQEADLTAASTVIKATSMNRHVARIKTVNVYKVLVCKSEGKNTLEAVA